MIIIFKPGLTHTLIFDVNRREADEQENKKLSVTKSATDHATGTLTFLDS